MNAISRKWQNRRQRQRRSATRQPRRGSVLFVVLVVIALLTLAVYQFSGVMLIENKSSLLYGRRVQARAFAESGVEVAAAMLGERQLMTAETAASVNIYHNPEVFGAILMQGDESKPARARGRYAVVSPAENDPDSKTVRFGLADESGKLNVNTLLKMTGDDDQGRIKAVDILIDATGMDEDTAEAILDWIDKDDETIYSTLEEDEYEGYLPKNGPLESLDELLLIPGVTPNLLFGADANRNGIIDADEFEATITGELPEGVHPLGWSAFLTVHSRETNLRLNGDKKLYLNEGILTDLYDGIVEEFSENTDYQVNFDPEELAQFIVAFRMYGPSNLSEDEQAAQEMASSSGGSSQGRQQVQQATQKIAKSVFGAAANGGMVTRGGMDLSGGANVTVNSIYDLIDAEVEVEIDGAMQTLTSPFSSENMTDYLPELLDRLTMTQDDFIEGRVNVNQTRKEILRGLINAAFSLSATDSDADTVNPIAPDAGEVENIVETIMASKMIDSEGKPLANVIAARQSTAWLVADGHVSLAQMRMLDRFLTTRGD
ncbi:MAG: general secretion pathway protein GspK, partial [Planctomycetes bacterium]|nr:general secretion pathway protein GspK [Planctomycetota bacterium]